MFSSTERVTSHPAREVLTCWLCGQGPEQVAHPPDALRVQPVGGLVEDQHLRVPEQRRRDAQTLAHAEGVAPERPVRGGAEPG
jgi:hypothetical protein